MPEDKVLLISCYFPPAGGIGVQRALSLARYLPQNGFRVFVLTSSPRVPTVDNELTKLIPDDVEVHRTWSLEPPFHMRKRLWSRISASPAAPTASHGIADAAKDIISRKVKQLICPDPQVLWYPFAIRRASKLIREEGIQTVLVTVPPFSSFLIANELKRRFPHLRTIADIRDEWLTYFAKEFAFRDDKYVAARAAHIERATVESCDRVVSVTASSLNVIRSRYPEQASEKFMLIPNGYDPGAFFEFRARPQKTDNVVVSYTGTIYKPSSPKTYLDALDGLPQIRSNFQTRFVGRIAEEFDRSVFDNRQSSVRFFDFVPQRDAVRFMEDSDVLLLPWADRINVPGKVFEYLVTGKPILALSYPDSELARVIKETASGWCVNPEDIGAIQRMLTEIHALAGKFPLTRNWEAIRRYERPRLATEYAQLIRETSRPDTSLSATMNEQPLPSLNPSLPQ